MPLYSGETLRQRLSRVGSIPLREAVEIALQIAQALACAHGAGLVHRDLKPANLMLLPDGAVKVLDFGLAKPLDVSGTASGEHWGTLGYMAPEQLLGERIDARADFWALGVVVCEMLGGVLPGAGNELPTLPADVPRGAREALTAVLRRLLAVERNARYGSAVELQRDLREVLDRVAATGLSAALDSAPHTLRLRRLMATSAAITLAIVLVALAILIGSPPLPTRGSAVGTPAVKSTYSGLAVMAVISADGQFLLSVEALGDSARLRLADLVGRRDTVLAGYRAVHSIQWSPDASEILVSAFPLDGGPRVLQIVPRLGSPVRSIDSTALPPGVLRASWLPDGVRISVHASSWPEVIVIDRHGTIHQSLRVPSDYTWLGDGAWAPDGRRFVVAVEFSDPLRYQLVILSDSEPPQILHQDTVPLSAPHWSPGGDSVLFARGIGSIMLIATGVDGEQTAAEVYADPEMLPYPYGDRTSFTLTPDGSTLAFAKGDLFSNVVLYEPSKPGAPPAGDPLTTGTALRWSPVASPTGDAIAYVEQSNGSADIFRQRLGVVRGRAEQITHDARVHPRSAIAWSSDGGHLAFHSLKGAAARLWTARVATGQTTIMPTVATSTYLGHLSWSPAQEIIYQVAPHDGLRLIDPATKTDRPFENDLLPGGFFSPRYSPAGDRVAVAWQPAYVRRGSAAAAASSANRPPAGLWIFNADGTPVRQIGDDTTVWPIGWSADERFVYAQSRRGPTIIRFPVDSLGKGEPMPNAPRMGERDCSVIDDGNGVAFLCAEFGSTSDVYMVNGFDAWTASARRR